MIQYLKVETARVLIVVLLLLICFSTTGCATWIKIKVEKAPELNLLGIKKLKIEKFMCQGGVNNDDEDFFDKLLLGRGDLFDSLFDTAFESAVKAITGFDIKQIRKKINADIENYHLDTLKSEIQQNGYFEVTERADFGGKIFGKIYYDVDDDIEKKSLKRKHEEPETYYECERTAIVTVTFSVIDKSGKLIGTTEVNERDSVTSRGNTRREAQKRIKDWEDLVKEVLDKTNVLLLKKIAPYYIWEYRKLAEGKSESIRQANKWAKSGNWGDAVQVWEKTKTIGSYEDRVACTYNLGIYDEAEGRLQDAIEKFKEAYSLSKEPEHQKEIIRMENRITERQQLEESACH